MDNKSIIAVRIKSIIKEKGFIQQAIGEKSGHNPKAFSAMLNGRKTIKAEYIPDIAEALGVTPNELYGIDFKNTG